MFQTYTNHYRRCKYYGALFIGTIFIRGLSAISDPYWVTIRLTESSLIALEILQHVRHGT